MGTCERRWCTMDLDGTRALLEGVNEALWTRDTFRSFLPIV